MLTVVPTEIPEVKLVTPKAFADARGSFAETYNHKRFVENGIAVNFVQDNESHSVKAGTIRGLHFQSHPNAQDKLVRCGAGVVFDVAVDARVGSPTYGKWVGVELSAENGRQLLIPKGFLHGFVTRAPNSELLYKCSDVYAPDCDGAVRFDDPDLGIDWGIAADQAVLSPKDAAAPRFADFRSPFKFGG